MATVTVIIVNYNGGELLLRCLEALETQVFTGFDIMLVDNASTDDSLAAVEARFPQVTIMPMGENAGFAVANNRAVEVVTSDWVVLLNPDAIPQPEWLASLMLAAENYPDAVMFGSTQLDLENPNITDGAGDCYHLLGVPWRGGYGRPVSELPRGDVEIFGPCAAAALYQRKAFRQVGEFCEDFFCCCEDVDLAFRLRLQGHRAVQVRDAVVAHAGSAVIGKKSAFSAYYGARNRFATYVRCMPGLFFWPLLPVHLFLLQPLLLLKMLPHGLFGQSVKGLFAGLWQLPALLRQRRMIQKMRKAPLKSLWRVLAVHPGWLVTRKVFQQEGS